MTTVLTIFTITALINCSLGAQLICIRAIGQFLLRSPAYCGRWRHEAPPTGDVIWHSLRHFSQKAISAKVMKNPAGVPDVGWRQCGSFVWFNRTSDPAPCHVTLVRVDTCRTRDITMSLTSDLNSLKNDKPDRGNARVTWHNISFELNLVKFNLFKNSWNWIQHLLQWIKK